MTIKNIEVRKDILLIRTADGMIYRINKQGSAPEERTWVDNILSCAVSLVYSQEKRNGKMQDNLQNMNQLGE